MRINTSAKSASPGVRLRVPLAQKNSYISFNRVLFEVFVIFRLTKTMSKDTFRLRHFQTDKTFSDARVRGGVDTLNHLSQTVGHSEHLKGA